MAIDGWRGVAASLVVVSHALSYRYRHVDLGPAYHQVQRVVGPVSLLGVLIFFVISGYIITRLLLREEAQRGRVSIAAFYVRRCCRILPPLLALLAAAIGLAAAGVITLPWPSVASVLTFSCNTGIVECSWWVAHSWSLAVEEQYYLVWPLLFALLLPGQRRLVLPALFALATLGHFLRPPAFHSNFLAFACILLGAWYASEPRLERLVARTTTPWGFVLVAAFLVTGPVTPWANALYGLSPAFVLYLVFAGNRLVVVKAALTSAPLQWIGYCSYSLYLWQQLFLARPEHYVARPLPVAVLPVVVVASVLVLERPFVRLGHRWSQRIKVRPSAAAVA